jgi:hypothetical protein
VNPMVFVVLVLASYRITRFFVVDSLMGFGPDSGSQMSVRVDRFAYLPDGSDRSWLRGKVGDLLTCTWCFGAHVSWVVLCLWTRVWPWDLGVEGWVTALAVAGGQGFLNSRLNA